MIYIHLRFLAAPSFLTDVSKNRLLRKGHTIYNDKQEVIGAQSIQRYIHDINCSGIMEIRTCTNKKAGYYRCNFPLEPSEVAVIAQSVFQTQNLDKEAKKRVLNALMRLTNITGREHLKEIMEQLDRTTLR